ncbi:MAG: cell division protein FtsQ/DivIB, partial [Alphaproteobacteria bacterium]
PFLVRRTMLAIAAALLAAATFGTPYWLWHSGRVARGIEAAHDRILALTSEAGLILETVLVEGRKETPQGELLAALDVTAGQPMLSFDPRSAKQRLERIGWVRQASVERRLPGTIVVRIAERRPLALWQRKDKLFLVDDMGQVILRDRVERFANLPLIVGDDAPQSAAGLFAMLALAPQLNARVAAAVRVGGRRWNVRLENGIDVRLPEEGAAEAWQRLAEIERAHGILERDILAVDMRMGDRLVVQMSPEAAKRAREPGANT